jgi:hypothetical protein
MKSNKLFILTVCIVFFATSKIFCENKTKNWNVALSNAYFLEQGRNIQLEIERKFERTSIGLYAQAQNYVIPMLVSYEANYLHKGGFMDNGTSCQVGLQIARHFFKPESKWNFWVKGRVGANISNCRNYQGEYWYWDQDREKVYYTIAKKQIKTFTNLEMNVAVGLSRQVFDKFSVFIEPTFNCQFRTQNYRTNQEDFRIEGFLMLRYGVSFAF